MSDQATSALDARERHLAVARTALHRAADLLEHVDDRTLEVDEALELVFFALEELEPGPSAS
jgi:propanediol dehydratase small subunit